jgi:hypothetical protein
MNRRSALRIVNTAFFLLWISWSCMSQKLPVQIQNAGFEESSIKPFAERIPITDQGITQQPNSKMDWLLDAKFGLFIHWGLYAGPATGEWNMENNGVSPEKYRKLAYPESRN